MTSKRLRGLFAAFAMGSVLMAPAGAQARLRVRTVHIHHTGHRSDPSPAPEASAAAVDPWAADQPTAEERPPLGSAGYGLIAGVVVMLGGLGVIARGLLARPSSRG